MQCDDKAGKPFPIWFQQVLSTVLHCHEYTPAITLLYNLEQGVRASRQVIPTRDVVKIIDYSWVRPYIGQKNFVCMVGFRIGVKLGRNWSRRGRGAILQFCDYEYRTLPLPFRKLCHRERCGSSAIVIHRMVFFK